MPAAHEDLHERIGELFPYEMPFDATRIIGLFVLAVFGVVAAAAVLVDVPETVEAPFVLMPRGGADPVESPFDGVLEAVHVETGADVAAGDLLVVVRSPRMQELAAQLDAYEEDRAALTRERASLRGTYAINHDIQQAEISQREKEAAFRREYLRVYTDVLRRMETLGEQGLTSSVDLLNHRLGKAAAERAAALAEEQQHTARLALTRLEAEHAQTMQTLDSEAAKLDGRIESLRSQLRHVSGVLAEVRAPAAGTVVSVARRRAGDVVRVGQELCQVAPGDAPLRAKLQLEERRMARLREGQPVKLLFEAFPYQRYGVVEGALVWLSPATVASGEARAFLAHVEPEKLEVPTGERVQPLRAGMRGTARIQVGRRTLVEYAFEPLRQLRENLRHQDAASAE